MYLHRIAVACGEVTGKIFGMEQIAWVEYGQVDVRDWESGDVIATLSAGDAFGPTKDETWFFLAGGAGQLGEELPALTDEATGCASGAASQVPAELAEVTTLFADDRVAASMPAGDATLYVGLLTVAPGAAIGRPYASGDDAVPHTAHGSG